MAEQGHQYANAGGKAAKNKSQEYLHIGNAQEGLPSSSHQIERYRDTAYGREGTLVPPDMYAQEVLAALQMRGGIHCLTSLPLAGGVQIVTEIHGLGLALHGKQVPGVLGMKPHLIM